MKNLLIMRHGKSSWNDSSLPDHDRPLKKRGRKDSAKMGGLLKDKELVPDIILCSTAKRARETAEILIGEIDFEGEIQYLDSFYMAEPEVFYSTLRSLPDYKRVMLVGHNPGMETLLQVLTDAINSLPTAALAYIKLPIDSWQDLDMNVDGELKKLWLPRELDKK